MNPSKPIPSPAPDASGIIQAVYGKLHGFTTLRMRNFRKNELQIRITTTLGFQNYTNSI